MSPLRSTTLRLILGDQLNPRHSWFAEVRPDVLYVLMETRSETDYVCHHAQKVIAIFAAMRAFSRRLTEQGHAVHYIAIDDPSNRQDIIGNLGALLERDPQRFKAVQYQLPDEWRLDQLLSHWARECPVRVEAVESEHFLTARDAGAQLFEGQRSWLMETFYRRQRRLHGVLMTVEGSPQGGRWNFDADNRKPWHGSPPAPSDRRPMHDHSALWSTVVASGVQTMGQPDAARFRWPLNRDEALSQLDAFIEHGLPWFGDFQDALSPHSPFLFHSLLSFALNTKMLDPREVVQRAERALLEGAAPLHSVEGFVRQILGWREYVRSFYWAHMPGYSESNVLEHRTPLPPWFWTARTRMACLAHVIQRSLDSAYAHHIERLMVVGNFALLAGLDPGAVHRWYLGIYIDAFEWVEAPNTLGMSQYADGGRLATKPYVSSAAYLSRMGAHCAHCRYDPRERTGPTACPFNALYWDFLARHSDRLGSNPRLAMGYRQLAKMPREQLLALRTKAAQTLGTIAEL